MTARGAAVLVSACAAVAVAMSACASEGVVGSLATGNEGGVAVSPEASVAAEDAGEELPLVPLARPIAAGGASTCVKTTVGDTRCWGENGTGSLGIGEASITATAEPVTPTVVGRVKALAGGEAAQCAIRTGGTLYCWGDVAVELSGVPNGPDHLPVMTPFSLDSVTGDVATVAVGRYFTCTISLTGELRCFGLNDKGQLGLGSTTKQLLPTAVKGLDARATSVSASMGGLFACATTSTGAVYCWGDNGDGQIGPGSALVTAPRRIEGLPARAVEVVAGGAHACARLVTGRVACWGRGEEGQLGDGASTSREAPVLADITDVVGLAAGRRHTCAVRSEGSVLCWGDDSDGQAGDTPGSERPWMAVPSSFGARHVVCGLAHTCAWGDGGQVRCFGSDTRSQLGPRTATF